MAFILSLASFSAALLYLYMGLRVYRLHLNRHAKFAFLLISVLFAFWAFCYTFLFMAENAAKAALWYRISTAGWTIMLSAILHFCIVFTRR